MDGLFGDIGHVAGEVGANLNLEPLTEVVQQHLGEVFEAMPAIDIANVAETQQAQEQLQHAVEQMQSTLHEIDAGEMHVIDNMQAFHDDGHDVVAVSDAHADDTAAVHHEDGAATHYDASASSDGGASA